MRSWQYLCAVSCIASSSSVNKLAKSRGSSQLNFDGVWAYLRAIRSKCFVATRHGEVCRSSNLFIAVSHPHSRGGYAIVKGSI